MNGPEVALAASAREWPDRLHRFLLDHGGGRVRARVMGPQQALEEQYEVLFIDDVCSFLTPRLVHGLREGGREVVGVFDPADGPDAKRHLLECGISDVVEQDASPEEFLSVAAGTLAHRHRPSPNRRVPTAHSLRVAVAGVSGGVGCTEIATALAASLARRRRTLLVDLDHQAPSLAQRLDLPPHPNLLTAVDLAHRTPGEISKAVHRGQGVDVVPGPATRPVSPVSPVEVGAVLDELGRAGYQVEVADLGWAGPSSTGHLSFRVLVLVGVANPVGITRLIRAVESFPRRRGFEELLLVVNRAPRAPTRLTEIRSEMDRLLPDLPVLFVPEEPRLERAAWDGSVLTRGPFVKAIERLASVLDEVATE